MRFPAYTLLVVSFLCQNCICLYFSLLVKQIQRKEMLSYETTTPRSFYYFLLMMINYGHGEVRTGFLLESWSVNARVLTILKFLRFWRTLQKLNKSPYPGLLYKIRLLITI